MTKKTLFFKFSILVFTTIVFALTLHGISHALTFTHIYVDAVNGTNAPTGRGSAAKPYQSITFALLLSARNNLPDPWHVHIRPGTYDADLAKPVNAREIFPLKLRREMIFEGTTTAEECVIDGQHTGAALVPILHGEDTEGVTIRNLTIQNSLRTNGVGGIILHDPTGTKETPSTLEGCIVHNNKGGGVWSNMPLILTGNTFSSNGGAGVWTNRSTAATNNIFSDNTNIFSDNTRAGLFIDGDSTGDIFENTFQNNGASGGLHVTGTLKANVAHNTFNNNNVGRHGGGFYAGTFTGDVTHNAFNNNSVGVFGGGFYAETFTGDVTHNTFTRNTSDRGGGFFAGTFTGDVTHNTFNNNNSDGGGFFANAFTGDVIHNAFNNNNSNSNGGGFSVYTFTGDVTHNTFTRNTSHRGGGLGVRTFTGNVTHNIFDSNSGRESGGFHLEKSTTNTVKVFNNIFFNNTARDTGNAVIARHATHFMNNLFMISDELSEGVSSAHTIWVSSPQCRFHNNIFSGVKTAIYTDGTFDLPITHNLFHDVKVDFVEQAGNNLGNDLLFWELVAVNATNNLEGAPLLVDPVTLRDFHLQAASPAINAGTNQFAPSDDFDGVARPVGKTVDIGPYEYGGKPAPTDNKEPVVDKPIVDDPVVETLKVKIYWTTAGKIQRANSDGSNIETLVTTGLEYPQGIALDVAGDKMYWTDSGTRSIQRANLDGSNIETLVTTRLEDPRGIALDMAGDKMYWVDLGARSIQRANLDGSNIETLVVTGKYPRDIALDVAGGKMYWTDFGTRSIQRANLDGTNVEALTTAKDLQDIALDVAGGKMYWTDGFGGIKRNNLDGAQAETLITDLNFLTDIDLDIAGNKMYWIGGEGGLIQRANLDGSNIEDIASQKLALYSGIALGISRQSLDRTPQRLEIVSGVDQKGSINTALANPFVVKVRDGSGSAFAGVAVTFAITAGGGSLSIESATTDADGRAESTLTLGPDVGANTVSVSVSGIQQTITFTAVSTPPETSLLVVEGTITHTDGSPAEAGLPVTVTIGSTTQTAVSAAGGNYRVTFINLAGVVASSLDTVEVQVLREMTSESAEKTVQLSSEQIIAQKATIDLQFLPPTAAEYLLSVPSGISLIHVPLKVTAVDDMPQTITSIGDLYDALGGTSVVNFLITYDPQTQEWRSYFVPSDKGGTADATLTDDKGVIAGLRTPVSVRLRGGALGTNETSTITLNQGLNLVGLPLNDSRIMRVSDLFALEGDWRQRPCDYPHQ